MWLSTYVCLILSSSNTVSFFFLHFQRASNEYFDMVIFMTFFILVSIVCFILLLKVCLTKLLDIYLFIYLFIFYLFFFTNLPKAGKQTIGPGVPY